MIQAVRLVERPVDDRAAGAIDGDTLVAQGGPVWRWPGSRTLAPMMPVLIQSKLQW